MKQKYVLMPGRWQGFHAGHKHLIDSVLARGKHVCIAIRDTDIDDKNPYTVAQREMVIRSVYGDDHRVRIISIPDIEGINYGRGVGFYVNEIEVPPEVAEISATGLRNGSTIGRLKDAGALTSLFNSTVWFTGLPCSGKTTLCQLFKDELELHGLDVVHLDGDTLRQGLCSDLGFSVKDRHENLRRVAELCKLENSHGRIVLASFISPTFKMRETVRSIIPNTHMVYVKCSQGVCAERDVKGMWKLAAEGKITGFTGYDAPYEIPSDDEIDLMLDTEYDTESDCIFDLRKKFSLDTCK